MYKTFVLNSDKHFIRRASGTTGSIAVYEYEGNKDVFDILHISHWNRVCVIYGGGNYIQDWSSLEVYGVKFKSSGPEFASLVSDLTLAGKDGERASDLTVNRNGVCFVNVRDKEWVRKNDYVFSWSKHGVEIPWPRGSEVLNVLGRVNGAVSEELLALRGRSKMLVDEDEKLKAERVKVKKEHNKLKEETVSFLKRSLEEKEKEVGSLKSDLKEKEEEVLSIKVALNELMDK